MSVSETLPDVSHVTKPKVTVKSPEAETLQERELLFTKKELKDSREEKKPLSFRKK